MKKRRSSTGSLPRPPAAGNRRPPPRRTPEDGVRATAAWVVDRTLASMAPVDAFLPGALSRHDARDQGLLRELVLGTLRWLRRLDHVIVQAAGRPMKKIESPLRTPLRIAAYQILFLDRIPPHAAVNEAVEQARGLTHRGGVGFVNAVLRRIARSPRLADWPIRESDPVRRLGIELSHPDLLVKRWLERFGAEATRSLLEANNRPRPLGLLAFKDRGGRELLAERLIDEGLEVEPSYLSPLGLLVREGNPLTTEAFRRGELYIQDEASQVSALLPPPRPEERVFDAAAAPGGKTLALVAAEPSLRIVAGDLSPVRLDRLAENLRRLERSLPLVAADAGRPPFRPVFDRVVLDLPCTGTGTLRKNPELKWRISEGEIGRLSGTSLRLLQGGARLVAPGGLLVAITCSLEKEENEEVVERFLAGSTPAASAFERLPLGDVLAGPLAEPIRGPGLWRLLTGGDHDGFTVQVLRHTGG